MTPVGYLSLHNIYYELRNRLMIELIIGQNNSNIASVMMLATRVELVQKIDNDPLDMIIDCRKASSALSPNTMASTIGAMG